MKRLLALLFCVAIISSSAFGIQLKPGGMQDGDMYEYDKAVKNFALNSALNKAGITIATATENIKFINTVKYTVDGQVYEVAPQTIDISAVISGTGVQAISTYRKYLISVNKSGTFLVTAGDSSVYNNAKLPDVTADYTPIGYFKVLTDSSTTYNCGTTKLEDPGITDVYISLVAMTSGKAGVRLNETVIDDDDTTEVLTSSVTQSGDLTLSSGTTLKPVFTIENTNADANSASTVYYKNSASPADNDVINTTYWKSNDNLLGVKTFVSTEIQAEDVTTDNEDASYSISVMKAGTLTEALRLESGELTLDVPTSSITVTTGNVNIKVTIRGIDYYIKANTSE